jgi:hypothetical protein
MSFSKASSHILLPFLDDYKKATNGKGRNEVVKNATEAVKEGQNLLEENDVVLPKDLNTVLISFSIY